MASITEILTLVVIMVGILVLPKMFRPEEKKTSKKKLSASSLSVPIRFGIVISILTPSITAIFFHPWDKGLVLFILYGIIPLIVWWGLFWIIAGLKNKSKTVNKSK